MYKIAIVYFKDPLKDITGMDILRWHAIAQELHDLEYDVDLITDLGNDGRLGDLKIKNVRNVKWSDYDVVKTRNHSDIQYVDSHDFIISRIGRVVDEKKPEREEKVREKRLRCQEEVFRKARYVSFMCIENEKRWLKMYGTSGPKTLIVPTGCPEEIPSAGHNPFRSKKNVLYAGSLTSPRFVKKINSLGRILKENGIHITFMGRNNLDLYGKGDERIDDHSVENLGCLPVDEVWDYMYYADVGLVFARGKDVFDNEISKIYYYLRAGLPVLSEEYIANNSVILETGHGEIFNFDDDYDAFRKIADIIDRKMDRTDVKEHMKREHSWKKRAMIYDDIIRTEL